MVLPFYYVIPLFQIIAIVHVLKTGRSWFWAWIIFMFPGLGLAVYFFMEILPEFRAPKTEAEGDSILDTFMPGRKLGRLEAALEDSGTVQNRKALADYYLAAAEPMKSVELYRQCLTGVYKDDPHLNLGLAGSLVEAGEYTEAKNILEGLRKRNVVFETSKRDLFYARVLESLGQEKEALQVYEDILKKYGSEVEGTCRLAQLFEKMGQKEKAKALYDDLLKRAKRFAPHFRRQQQAWIKLAKEKAKGLSLN
jgi:hypothetical protein